MYRKLLIVFLISISVFLSSCYDENNTFGKNLVESVFRNIYTDTCSVTVTLMKIDSLETSGTSVVMLGQYEHPIWGKVIASSYLPFSRPSYSTDISNLVVFDSLMLQLRPNSHFIGDTMQNHTIYIHQLTEKIVLNDKGYLYNTNTFSYDPEPIAMKTFRPHPNEQRLVEVRLNDELGEDFLTRLHNRDDIVSSERFEDFFKGLVLLSDQNNTSLQTYHLGDTTTVMVLHYHILSDLPEAKTLNITVNTSKQFNNFLHERDGTLLESIEMKDVEVSSTELDNKGLLFAGLGWYCNLEFPYLNDLQTQGEQVEIESAYLKIYPEYGTYSDFNTLPDSIYLYIVDENNVITDAVTDYLGNEVQIATLISNYIYPHTPHNYFDGAEERQPKRGAR
ncbi:MAG: DUF4270 domain-containing protein, partial [Tannerellaceae bacterium]|nr:DUF4270 domain-containing protein [Tannerellaceae bacterium]